MKNESKTAFLLDILSQTFHQDYRQIKPLIDRTYSIYGTSKFVSGGGSGMFLLLLGQYPADYIVNELTSRPEWIKKTAGGGAFWENRNSGISLSLPESYSLFITNEDRSFPMNIKKSHDERRFSLPERLSADFKKSMAAFYFPFFSREGLPERIPLNRKRIPIKETGVYLYKKAGRLCLDCFFNCQGEKNARLFQTSFKTFLLWWFKEIKVGNISQIIKEINIKIMDNYLYIDGLSLSSEDLSRGIQILIGDL
ncbi:MAG: hypothetical protein JW969_11915 [Spirochaetales bacterium]|nr:hypothetical protein [Spirochaetales bacterium]